MSFIILHYLIPHPQNNLLLNILCHSDFSRPAHLPHLNLPKFFTPSLHATLTPPNFMLIFKLKGGVRMIVSVYLAFTVKEIVAIAAAYVTVAAVAKAAEKQSIT